MIDTETTGLEGEVIEVAAVVLESGDEGDDDAGIWDTAGWMSSLVRPSTPIEVEAMAVHHITEEMVSGEMTMSEVVEEYKELQDVAVAVAHNAKFDSAMMPDGFAENGWICTYRCACHLWPDAPSHGNQALRYWLKLDVSDMPGDAGMTPHRALYDAWVTSKLLMRMLQERTADELLRMTTEPAMLAKMRFGKHRGELFSEIPWGYLEWLVRQGDSMCPDHVYTARAELDRRRRS